MHPVLLTSFLGVIAAVAGIPLLQRWPRRTPTLYLTFDDGPHPEETPRLLDVLDHHGIKATFFVIGTVAEKHPELVRSVAEAGHTLGNHSMTHPWFNRLSMREQLEEIRLADAVLEQFDGRSVHPFRPPHGRWTLGSLIACKRRSQRMVLWTHDSLDYRCSADEVVSHLRSRKIGKGDILLFHDDGPTARQALELLVPEWQAAGFAFSALD